jgi:hypothetical protein
MTVEKTKDTTLIAHFRDDFESNDFSFDDVCRFVEAGQWHLLVSHKVNPCNALVYSLIKYPKRTIACVVAIAGKDIDQEEFDDFASIIKAQGAHHIVGQGSRGIARLWNQKFGFVEKQILFERKI